MQKYPDNIIFVHGPSGAGKGAGIEELTKLYTERGYKIVSIASGDLYRAAGSDPKIRDEMRQGLYIDTLGAIIPGLQDVYGEYLQAMEETNGKAVIILDGFIRRDAFVNEGGVPIESQIDQITHAFVEKENSFKNLPTPITFEEVKSKVLSARHILVDIDPRDAMEQMKIRVNREIDAIARRVMTTEDNTLPAIFLDLTYMLGARLAQVIGADGTSKEGQQKLYLEAEELRSEISEMLGMTGIKYFSEFFKTLEIKTGLRDDDIKPESREQRVSGNYVKLVESPEGNKYELAFAAQALVDGLGYKFDEKSGTFSSDLPNLEVVRNGKSRGITFESFKESFRDLGARMVDGVTHMGGERNSRHSGDRK